MDKVNVEKNISVDLAQGRTGTGTISFEVPKDAKDIEMDYSFDYLNTGVFIYSE